mmetsp:Transcript_30189/g.59781  ORF Transcript_30189/g.59781 Transcript_30189/m.59781 type:complete len:1115 (-) Transcript_30189:17-3361(-)|eukprot:CAMPEP_0194308324 /NCGR_PEP_ID=MMETSP0171-20130528/5281_1 /TAXON_ID=218684 /ORGANISM="Corethron pennatum, Strain L29A3" /LENGTH=1114 /DNA_ID=CAMNT_0039060893 /DNA_START=92 /DNA_END=3436 /DNA_ORIENTATION=-
MSASQSLTKDFFELIKGIGEAKSKQEEDRIIIQEISNLKRILAGPSAAGSNNGGARSTRPSYSDGFSSHSSPNHNSHGALDKAADRARDMFSAARDATANAATHAASAAAHAHAPHGANPLNTSKKRSREFLVRLMYVEMLGHDAGFGYIKAVELAASSSILHKRTGYVTCGACLAPSHEFRFMLVNQLQRDLGSANVLEASVALVAVSRLITADMVPAVSTEVGKLVNHQSDMVRKKSIFAMHRLHVLDPRTFPAADLVAHLRRLLCDRDPGVMGACLAVVESICCGTGAHSRAAKSHNSSAAALYPTLQPFKDLVPSLVSILKQVCEHRLPSDYDYHRMPAPWIQMKIVRILGALGRGDLRASEGMYEILSDCMRRSDTGINVGYAVCYECVRTITAIYPNTTLLDAAADAISRFIASRNHNLKYIGVTGLAAIVADHPKYAAAHQMAVIECLEDPDETLQRKTLDLLFRMTNPVNVRFIADRLLQFLRGTSDGYLRHDLTARITQIAERYAPDNGWYVEAITALFEISGDLVRPDVAHNLMTLIAEGGDGDGDDEDDSVRRGAVEMYIQMLDRPGALPKILTDTMAWVLGEYAYLSESCDPETVITKMCALATRPGNAPSTRKYLVAAVMKLVAQAGTCPPIATRVVDDFTRSGDVDLQQRCLEFQGMLGGAPHLLAEVLPIDASCEDLEADASLSFLDSYVQTAIAKGARTYSPPDDDDSDDDDSIEVVRKPKFNMTAYAEPTKPQHNINIDHGGPSSGMMNGSGSPMNNDGTPGQQPYSAGGSVEPQLKLRAAANVWGAPTPAASSVTPVSNIVTPAAVVMSSSAHTRYGVPPPAPPPQPQQSRQMTEKEKMAAALFGGIPGSGAVVPPPAPRPIYRPTTPKAVSPVPVVSTHPPAPAAAPAKPAPVAAAMDLLDLGGAFDPTPTQTQDSTSVDVFAPAPAPAPAPSIPHATPAAAPVPVPAVDPFAAANLLSSVSNAPLGGMAPGPVGAPPVSDQFVHGGAPVAPLSITTPQFGGKWGPCPYQKSAVVPGSHLQNLQQFMEVLVAAGLHGVEAIAATNEGIAAGQVGQTILLVHGKLGAGGQVNFTVKSTDQGTANGLASWLSARLGR